MLEEKARLYFKHKIEQCELVPGEPKLTANVRQWGIKILNWFKKIKLINSQIR